MIPPMPTGVPSASQMRQSSPVSPRLRPCSPVVRSHAVEGLDRLAGPGPAHNEAWSGQERQVVGVGGLAELEHDVVGGVDDVVDRAHARQQQALCDVAGRRADRDVAQDGHREPRAEVGRLHRRAGHLLHRLAARSGRGGLGQREGQLQPTGQVAGDPRNAPGIGAVALDGNVEDGVDAETERLHDRRPRLARRLVAEDQQAGPVVGEAELLARAEHAVGGHAPQLALTDLEAPGQDGPDRRQRHPVPHLEVGGAAHDLEWFGPARRRRWSGGFCRRP